MTGTNMFAYCGNNPVNYVDPSGALFGGIFSGIVAAVASINPVTLLVGLACVGCVILVAGLPAVEVNISHTTVSEPPKSILERQMDVITSTSPTVPNPSVNSSSIDSAYAATGAELGRIAGQYGEYQCVEAARAMQKYLTKNKLHGKVITIHIWGGRGYIVSKSKGGDAISTNGVHVGIQYGTKVYCNVHPEGMYKHLWIDDFEGVGIKTVSEIYF